MRIRHLTKRPLVALVALATMLALALPALGGGRPLSAELDGASEVPASTSQATGSAHFTLNQGQGEVCFEIEASGFASDILAAHIHIAPEGVAGPIVVPLFGAFPEDTEFFAGCVDGVDSDLIKDIRQNPDAYYVNIHTVNNPPGAIRGQLSK